MNTSRVTGNKNRAALIATIAALILSASLVLLKSNIATRIFEMKRGSRESLIEHYDRIIPVLIDYYDIPGVCISLIKDGKQYWSGSYGFADLEKGTRMSAETCFRVESISKSVTAWGVTSLIEEGKIDPSRPVENYLNGWKFPESEFDGHNITTDMLLSHTAGLPLGDFTNRYSPTEEIPGLKESLYREAIITRNPGYSYSYSNVGFNVLELLIEEVSGQPFPEFMKEFLLKPLGMDDSSFEWNKEIEGRLGNGYNLEGKHVPTYVYPQKAAGGLFSDIDDISRFVAAGMTINDTASPSLLSRKSIEEMYSPAAQINGLYGLVFQHYGKGHFVEYLNDSELAVSHGGQGYGWMTHFHMVREKGDGIVILTNSQRSWPFFGFILKNWAEWNGYERVGMQVIPAGEVILWILIFILLFFVLGRAFFILLTITSGDKVFIEPARDISARRVLMFIISLLLLLFLAWCANQDYLLISSIFPATTGMLSITVILLSLMIILGVITRDRYDSANTVSARKSEIENG